jgi:hypothetical protein
MAYIVEPKNRFFVVDYDGIAAHVRWSSPQSPVVGHVHEVDGDVIASATS